MSAKLGRGLGSLYDDAPVRLSGRREGDPPSQAQGAAKQRATLPVEQLQPNKEQPRKIFSDEAIEELAHSIRARGMLQPILVRPLGRDSYEIVAGERRWRAAQKAQLHDVPVIIRELTDEEAAEIALIENVQRVDLSPIEEARAYDRLATHYKRSHDEIAKAVGKSRSHVVNSIRILALPRAFFDAMEGGLLSAGHARALIGAPDQEILLSVVLAKKLSVRETEALVREAQKRSDVLAKADKELAKARAYRTRVGKGPTPAFPPEPAKKDADTRALEEAVAAVLGLLVTIHHKPNGSGMIGVGYSNLDQLDDVCRRLMGTKV